MDISHFSNPSPSMSTRPYDQVFLSFRGSDTRRNFADFLYTSLTDAGIHVFRNEEESERGQEIQPQLIEAIEQSMISIPVISKESASSKSCLMELNQMVKCMDNKNRIIIPIFYYVDPSDVRDCMGPFEKALGENKKRDRDGNFLNHWMSALRRIGGLKGYHLHENLEVKHGKVIKLIVREVQQKLKMRDLIVTKQLVGVDPHVQEIMAKLKVDYRNGQAVKIGDTCEKVLIHGIPGVGKTVLAKCVYNQLHYLFDACSFLEKIQEEIRDDGIVSVQNRLISHLLKGNAPEFACSDDALTCIQNRFHTMKVLLLLDDVKDQEQLSALMGELDWLDRGSMVILTSQRRDVLQKVNGAETYLLGSMKEDKALTLFCKHAFNKDSPPEDFEKLATEIVAATDGLPLALEKVGGFLFRKSKKVWTEKLIQLKEAPDESVREAFLKSYRTLDENEKNIFLDIACFFNGMDKRIPYYMWHDLQFSPSISIPSLRAMSLVEIGENKVLRMHAILVTFGREIVKSERKNEPCKRSRLWNHEDALDVLIQRKGTKSVEALGLEFADVCEGKINFECDQFDGLQNLRYLKLDWANIQGNFGDRLSRLRWLDWQGCPKTFEVESLNLNMQNLVILDLSWSQVDRDWRGWELLEQARKLKVLKLTACVQLTATPKFPASMELERLILEGCSNLAVIDPSFEKLNKLVSLNMKGCCLLRELPDLSPMRDLKELVIDGTSISRINFQGSMMMLKTLSARHCEDLTDISNSIGGLISLKYLALDGSGIHTLPESIGSLKQLKTLSLKNCQRLTHLPDGIRRRSLETLRISSAMCFYDVFLIFRGLDTGRNFVDILDTMLTDAGICVCREEKLERGKEIQPELKAAIVQSKISIPVISKEFASSESCLMELEQMLECMRNSQHTIIPIFYNVDPSNEHNYNGSFERSFIEHKEHGVCDSVIDSWKSALYRIRKLKGYHLHKNSDMDGRLTDLFSYVTRQLKGAELVAPSMLVRIDDQVREMMTTLVVDYCNRRAVKIHGSKARMVGIHGIQGIGKTTLAKCVYNQLYPLFEGCSYLGNIREISKTKSLEHLQSQLVSDLLKQEPISLDTIEEGIYYIKHRFRNTRVLIVLDDVNEWHQLEALAGNLSWFGSRSRIIVTTRKADLLNIPGIATYEVKPMDFDESLRLFCQHAFRESSPHEDYEYVSRQIVQLIGGIPLAIEVAGSNLYKQDRKMWDDMFRQLKERPGNRVHQVLRTPYDALDQGLKDIFLDIACFFIGKDKRIPFYMWEDCSFDPWNGITSLVRMSLVKIKENNKLLMYDSFRDLGQEIVIEEPTNLGRRSRQWNHEDALDTLKGAGGKERVEALCLKLASGSHNCFASEEFQGLSNLRFLKLDNANLRGNFMSLLSNLRWLDWQGCPDTFEANNLHLKNLVILELPSSKITHKWKGWNQIEMPRLKVLNLTGCNEMQITPDFSPCPLLEMLILKGCSQLVKIDPSICRLRFLVSLNLKSCSNLSVLPLEMGNMEKLEELLIDGTSIQEIPKSIDHMKKLKTLSASNCYSLSYLPQSIECTEALSMLLLDNAKILELPNSIGNLVKLRRLSLKDCRGIKELPQSIGELGRSLVELDVSGMLILKLPNSVRNLQLLRVLKMERCHVGEFPGAIGELRELEEIHASHCRNLKGSIPRGIGNLRFLKILMLGYSCVSSLPRSIQSLSHLQTLDLLRCDNLETLPVLPPSLTCLQISSTKMRIIPTIENLVKLEDLSFGDENPKERIVRIVPPPAFDPKSTLTKPQSLWPVRFPKLKSLELSHSQILNLQFEYGSACIPQLKKVVLTGANLERVSKLPSSLSILSIQACLSLKSLPTVQNLINLSELELLNSAVKEIKGLWELQSLEVLAVSDCPIVHLEGLSNLTSLKRLSLKNCNVLDKLPDVSNLIMLKVLEIHQCQRIHDIEGLEELSSLEELHVSGSEAERSSRATHAQERIRESWSTSP